jgi:excisionase family DNA binding protein
MDATNRFLSKTDLSVSLGVSPATINRRLADGTIPFIKIGTRVLIPADYLSRIAAAALNKGGAM